MNKLKRYCGVLWLLSGPLILLLLAAGAIENINATGTKDINKPVPWIIIIAIFTPVSVGLTLFGYYALKGEYDHLPQKSEELN